MDARGRQFTGALTVLLWTGFAILAVGDGRYWLGAFCLALAALRARAWWRAQADDEDD